MRRIRARALARRVSCWASIVLRVWTYLAKGGRGGEEEMR